jgi:hypothetical protein
MTVRKQGNKEAIDIADLSFYGTVVRLHREGEGASYTGLKPAGLNWSPVLPKVEKAMEKGYPNELVEFLSGAVEEQVNDRLKRFMETKNYDDNDVAAAREHVEAMLDLELYSHNLYMNIKHENGRGEESESKYEH